MSRVDVIFSLKLGLIVSTIIVVLWVLNGL